MTGPLELATVPDVEIGTADRGELDLDERSVWATSFGSATVPTRKSRGPW